MTVSRSSCRLMLSGDRTNAVTRCPLARACSTISRPVRPVAPMTKSFIISFLPFAFVFLIQSLPVAFNSDRQNNESEERDLPKLKADIDDAVALQQNSPDDAQKMRQRKNFADDLGPVWHAAKGKHETGEQDRREFFSSRRRHTILQGDWSSDVCSSD